MKYDYDAFKKKYDFQSSGVPHIKASWEWEKARQQISYFLATEIAHLEEIGILILMRDFIESMDSALDRVEAKWQPRLEEFAIKDEK